MRKIFITIAILTFTAIFTSPAPAQALSGEWELVMITKNGKNVPVAAARKTPSIKFEKENSAAGSGGCNSYGGSYTAGGGKIKFGPIRSTKMGCAGEINKQETLFFELLNGANRYQVSGGTLVLSDGSGNSLRFVSLAPPPPLGPDERPLPPMTITFVWIVDKKRVDCRGIVHQNCLQVKRLDIDEWQILREKIAGFKYRPGKYYLIRVKHTPDGYQLIKVIKRTRLMPHVD